MKKRITVEDVKQAYKKINRTPKGGFYFQTVDGKECACGIGALFLQNAPKFIIEKTLTNPHPEQIINLWANETYGELYRMGFVSGFDGEEDRYDYAQSDAWKNGQHDGVSVRLALDTQPI